MIRLSRWLATTTNLSRRSADAAIKSGRVTVNGELAELGQQVSGNETIRLDNEVVQLKQVITVLLNKPAGYVCSKVRQDSKPTIYELLPDAYSHLSYVGRLDADSEGLVIMTNDGQLTQRLTHPRYELQRSYHVWLDRRLSDQHLKQLVSSGVELDDGISLFDDLRTLDDTSVAVILHEGRNRQIRRSFERLGYQVTRLRRVTHGQYALGDIALGEYRMDDICT